MTRLPLNANDFFIRAREMKIAAEKIKISSGFGFCIGQSKRSLKNCEVQDTLEIIMKTPGLADVNDSMF